MFRHENKRRFTLHTQTVLPKISPTFVSLHSGVASLNMKKQLTTFSLYTDSWGNHSKITMHKIWQGLNSEPRISGELGTSGSIINQVNNKADPSLSHWNLSGMLNSEMCQTMFYLNWWCLLDRKYHDPSLRRFVTLLRWLSNLHAFFPAANSHPPPWSPVALANTHKADLVHIYIHKHQRKWVGWCCCGNRIGQAPYISMQKTWVQTPPAGSYLFVHFHFTVLFLHLN